MHRGLFFLFIIVGVLFYLGYRSRRFNKTLALALYAASVSLLLLLLAGFFGLVGGPGF